MDHESFRSKHLPENIQNKLQSFKRNGKFTDFVIYIGDEEFKVHKVLLAAVSGYFEAMFNHDSAESRDGKATLQDIEPTAMSAILDWFYTSTLNLGIDNVQGVIVAASILQIDDILNLCSKFIQRRLDPTNCLGVLAIAERYGIRDLNSYTLEYCLDRFDLIIEESEFLTLEEDLLEKIISHDRLNARDEELVFESILKWISHDVGERSESLHRLASHVRFALISPFKLTQLSRCEVIRSSNECRNLIDDAKDYLLLQGNPNEIPAHLEGPRFTPREPLRRRCRIYAIGGWTNNRKPIESAEKYDPYKDEWIEIEPMTRPRCGVGVTVLGDYLYAIGGHDGEIYMNNVERYNLTTNSWLTDVADMPSQRTSVGAVSLNGFIYAIGGQFSSSALNNVERYNPATNTWEDCRPLNDKRLGAGVTVLNGYIYALGGSDQQPLDTVERYDPELDRWMPVASMLTARKHFGCLAYKGKIYAVGGRDKSGEIGTGECYNPEEDSWTPIPEMKERRSGIGLVELDGLFYAIGGHNGDYRVKLVEAFDPLNQTWTPKKPMIVERLGGGIAVYPKLEHW